MFFLNNTGNWKVTIHLLFVTILFSLSILLKSGVCFFLQMAIFEVQSEFDPTAVRAQIEACWKRQLHWLLEDSGCNIRCLDMMRDVKFLRFQEKKDADRLSIQFLLTDHVYRTWWKFKAVWFVQHAELYIHIYHQALLVKKINIYSPQISLHSYFLLQNESSFSIYWCHC